MMALWRRGFPAAALLAWGGAASTAGAMLDPAPAVGAATAEEARLERAGGAIAGLELDHGRLTKAIAAGASHEARLSAARAVGQALWREQRRAVQSGALDDRPLYWQRLAAARAWRRSCGEGADCGAVLQAFEHASRGIPDLSFPADADLRIVVSGFDPFNLDDRVTQSNPSGLAALRLDRASFTASGHRVVVETVMLPVRFADFDAGLVEDIFAPLISGGTLDALVTVSMGRAAFDLERFPGRRRSAEAPDNLGVRTGASETDPRVPELRGAPLPGPEFVEFSLPAAAMLDVQEPYGVRDNRAVTTLERGTFAAGSLAELDGQTAVRGSGGGYLSNEVSYRTGRLVRQAGADIAVGHIHTPRVEGYDAAAEAAITDQVRQLLEQAAVALVARQEHR